jgi:hypothetical protein
MWLSKLVSKTLKKTCKYLSLLLEFFHYILNQNAVFQKDLTLEPSISGAVNYFRDSICSWYQVQRAIKAPMDCILLEFEIESA